ncbi:hypothetical protein ACA910_011156 [Epithemia clementina (nom. ined.)]
MNHSSSFFVAMMPTSDTTHAASQRAVHHLHQAQLVKNNNTSSSLTRASPSVSLLSAMDSNHQGIQWVALGAFDQAIAAFRQALNGTKQIVPTTMTTSCAELNCILIGTMKDLFSPTVTEQLVSHMTGGGVPTILLSTTTFTTSLCFLSQQQIRNVTPPSLSELNQVRAAVLFNLGLTYHLRALLLSTECSHLSSLQASELHRAFFLYNTAAQILQHHSHHDQNKGAQQQQQQQSRSSRRMLWALYNNMAHIRFSVLDVAGAEYYLELLQYSLSSPRNQQEQQQYLTDDHDNDSDEEAISADSRCRDTPLHPSATPCPSSTSSLQRQNSHTAPQAEEVNYQDMTDDKEEDEDEDEEQQHYRQFFVLNLICTQGFACRPAPVA